MARVVAALLLVAASTARADSTVMVTLNQAGQDMANQIGASVPQVIADAQVKINEIFELQQLPSLLNSFANTGVLANQALGVDYQPHPRDVMFGIVADSALASDARLTSSDEKVFSATIVNYGFALGVNLGRWNLPRLTISANGSYASTTIRKLAGELVSAGGHVQYRLVPSRTHKAIEWTGLDVTTGLEYSSWEIGLAAPVRLPFTVVGSNDRATVTLVADGTLKVVSDTIAVPIQVSTGVRLAKVLGLYAGGGLSLAGGTSTVTAMLDSQMVINSNDVPVGRAVITATESDGPTGITAHGFAGLQIHTHYVRVFAQGIIASGERAVALGLRAGFD